MRYIRIFLTLVADCVGQWQYLVVWRLIFSEGCHFCSFCGLLGLDLWSHLCSSAGPGKNTKEAFAFDFCAGVVFF